ncbi:PIN domain-like protein, partial [Schizophyllum commune]
SHRVQILESERALRSYAEVFVKEGYTDGRLYRVGIDAEGIMHAAQAVFNKRGHVQHGMNPELWAILCLLCRFACQPAVFIFVFDGPHKVKTKRGKRVMSQPIWLVDYFKLLIKNFGFHHRDATGEAEVELCHLQKRGALDIIFSEDSDVWVYGATRVIRRSVIKKRLAEYTAPHIYETLGLSQAGFLLFALVSGGDYDEGVAGVGPTIAHALARGPLANRLWQLIFKGRAYYKANIKAWRSDLVDELVHNRSGFLRKRERAVAAKLPKDFPRLDLVWQYAFPVSS